jgi:hypothetical protein
MACRNVTFAWCQQVTRDIDRRRVVEALESLTGLPWLILPFRPLNLIVTPIEVSGRELTLDSLSALVAEKHPDLRGKDLSSLFNVTRYCWRVVFVENDNNVSMLESLLQESQIRRQLVQELVTGRLALFTADGSQEVQQVLEGVLGLTGDLQRELLAMF